MFNTLRVIRYLKACDNELDEAKLLLLNRKELEKLYEKYCLKRKKKRIIKKIVSLLQ